VSSLISDPIAATDPNGPARSPHARRHSHRLPDVDTGRCTGCGRCVAACDLHLLSLVAVRWEKFASLHDADRCTGCSACALRCPFHAITLRRRA